MSDNFSDYHNNIGKPQLDQDYWKKQRGQTESVENINLFDNMINTNFDIETLKKISVFKAKQ